MYAYCRDKYAREYYHGVQQESSNFQELGVIERMRDGWFAPDPERSLRREGSLYPRLLLGIFNPFRETHIGFVAIGFPRYASGVNPNLLLAFDQEVRELF